MGTTCRAVKSEPRVSFKIPDEAMTALAYPASSLIPYTNVNDMQATENSCQVVVVKNTVSSINRLSEACS
jgi:hypothetical protein